ncbi:MAG TPA: DUF72 domain-containing protein [Rhizomicrobium sp.]|jgi:uncharacterized protein YecE (DUF72 family)|nr:DUF72 domain-containing protein [Rhizomicrobium sp.]
MSIRAGIGGWVYEPWRGSFYPKGLPQKRELEYAASKLTAIEINGTYYGSQKPESFARWRDETPEGFVFTLKGPRFATNRRVLAEAGDSIAKFFASGVTRLGDKLGPVNWQFMATKKFDAADFEAFLKLLPKKLDGFAIRHAVEVRHASFRDRDFVALCRKHDVAIVIGADSEFPLIADVTADFVYVRIMGTQAKEASGYSRTAIKVWADRARAWEKGGTPDDMPLLAPPAPKKKRDVFLFMIAGAKERNPAAAQALIAELG